MAIFMVLTVDSKATAEYDTVVAEGFDIQDGALVIYNVDKIPGKRTAYARGFWQSVHEEDGNG